VEELLNFRMKERSSPMRVVLIDEIDQIVEQSTSNGVPGTRTSRRRVSAARHPENDLEFVPKNPLEVLLSLFMNPKSNLLLIAIANSVSLVHSFSQSASSISATTGSGGSFESLVFEPYSVAQLKTIVMKRLEWSLSQDTNASPQNNSLPTSKGTNSRRCAAEVQPERKLLSTSDIVDEKAIEFCIRKICASRGDCRQALDATR